VVAYGTAEEAEARGPFEPTSSRKFNASLGNIVRFCLKKRRGKGRKKREEKFLPSSEHVLIISIKHF
jgi:hypothetical protein